MIFRYPGLEAGYITMLYSFHDQHRSHPTQLPGFYHMRSLSIIIGLVAPMHEGCGPDPDKADGQFGAIRSVYINGKTKTEESQKLP